MDRRRVAQELVRLAKELTGGRSRKAVLGGSVLGVENDVELLFNPFTGNVEVGMGGEWWGGKAKLGRNVYRHRKESVDPAYQPVMVVIREGGHDLLFEVTGGFGLEASFRLTLKGA